VFPCIWSALSRQSSRTPGEKPLRILIAIGALSLALSAAAPASAQDDQREYRRGYRDCLAGRYDEDHGHGYRAGCRDAQRERGGDEGMDERPQYRDPEPDYRRPEPAPAPAAPFGIPHVVGMNSIQAVGAMASRGYRNVGSSIVGGVVAGIYFNPVTRECVQLTNARGQVIDAREIGSHPQCR
jgi:hypothetical protein